MSNQTGTWTDGGIAQLIPPAAWAWLIITILLVIASGYQAEPNDYEQFLEHTGSGVISISSRIPRVDVGDGRLEAAYRGCAVEDAASDEALTNPNLFFNTQNCNIFARPGDTVWIQYSLLNNSEVPLENIRVTDSLLGEIPPDDACWWGALPTRVNPEPPPGWSEGAPGSLLANGDQAICIKPYTLPEDTTDQVNLAATISFEVSDETLGLGESVREGDRAEALEELAPDGTQITPSQVIRIIEPQVLSPNVWLFSFGFESERVVDVGTIETSLPLFLFTLGFMLVEIALARFTSGNNKLLQPLVRALAVFIVFWSLYGHEILWDALLAGLFPQALNSGDIEILADGKSVIDFAAEHLELVIVSSALIIPVGLALGILVTRESYRDFLPLVNGIVNLGQTIPTIAVVAFMAPIVGLGVTPAIVALFAYGLLPVVRNTVAGLEGVDRFTIESAQGMGMTPLQVLIQIELPIASRVILAGVRTSMVINVGTAALGAYVLAGGLGAPISNGLGRFVYPWVFLGAIPAALLAILLDYILGRVEYFLMPRGLQIDN